MSRFINVNGTRINTDHISNYFPGKDSKRTYICIDGTADPYNIPIEEIDKLVAESEKEKEISNLTAVIRQLWELLRARLH